MEEKTVLEGLAQLCDEAHNLLVSVGPFTGVIPREEAALGIAEGTTREIAILSRVDLLQEALEGKRSTQELAEFLDVTTQSTRDIDLILVGDTQSNLLYAPDHDLVDIPYSGTAQTDALAGAAPYTSDETGPMGSEHSAYAPILDDAGNVIGFIIVGVYFRSMAQLTRHTVVVLSVVGLAAAVMGSTLALRLSKRIKDSLMGYEPDAFVHRFHQREDIMDALEEGIMAIDRDKKLIFLNTAAAEMFSLNRDEVLGQSLALTVVAVFAYSATAYCIGSFMKRGSSMVPFIVMAIALPAVCALGFMYFMDKGTDLSWVFNLPCFLGEAALGVLGAPMSGSVGILILPYMDLSSVSANIAVGVVWGIAFFILGMLKTIRREM